MMTATLHPFEAAGLGTAPFRLVGLSEKVYSAAPGHSQPGGTCDYCGQGIKYVCHIRSAEGREFGVGTDCVRKLNRDDNRLASDVEREVAKLNAAKREAARRKKWAEREEARQAELDRQRAANGGLTDQELADQRREQERAALVAKWSEANGWLLDVLTRLPYSSEFVGSMVGKLEQGPASGLSDRCLDILRDIYAKQNGRRGSKAYQAAAAEFDSRLDESTK